MKRKFKLFLLSTLSSSFGLALIISIPIWIYLLHNFSRVEITVTDEGAISKNRVIVWDDFNGDGISDYCDVYLWKEGFYSIPFRTLEGEVSQQFNLQGKPGKYITQAVFSGDHDNNGLAELYTLLHRKDSLFLNIIEPYGKGHFVKRRFISKVYEGKAGYDFDINGSVLCDVNKDGFKEYAFIISAGFSISPRCICVYDIHNNKLSKTDHLGANPHELRVADINSDNIPEFLLCNYASNNMSLPVSTYMDNKAYVYVFDDTMTPIFKPMEFAGPAQFVKVFPVTFQKVNYYCVFHKCNAKTLELGFWFYLIDSKGNIIRKKKYDFTGADSYIHVFPQKLNNEDAVLILKGNSALFTLNECLELEKLSEFPEEMKFVRKLDLDGDQKNEFVFISKNGRSLYVFRNNFKNYVSKEIKCVPTAFRSSLVNSESKEKYLYLRADNLWFNVHYKQISFYLSKVASIVVCTYGVMFFLVWFIQRMTVSRDRRRKKMAELQLTSWKNQLDPHFTFNTLNSVGAVILSEERYKAYDFFSRFTKLMRYALEASSKVCVKLEEELKFIDLYLQLEQFRFKNQFTYQITIAGEVNQGMKVPKMLLQTYIENAVRHGLNGRTDGADLQLKIYKANRDIIFHVEDNGIGRMKSSQESRFRSGVGMKVMKEYFNLLNSINNRSIKVKVIDRDENDEVYPGTIVYIMIPEGFSYSL